MAGSPSRKLKTLLGPQVRKDQALQKPTSFEITSSEQKKNVNFNTPCCQGFVKHIKANYCVKNSKRSKPETSHHV
jgi:hypothetical protein